jgi:hypothetical protein
VAHDLRSDGVEMGSIVPSRAAFRHQPQERLLYEGRRLKCMVPALAVEVAPGQSKQVRADQRPQFIERRGIALTPGSQQSRDFAALAFHTAPDAQAQTIHHILEETVVSRAG